MLCPKVYCMIVRLSLQSLEQLLGVTVGEDFLGSLEDGIVLCQLMNKLHPGTIAHFHTPTDDQVSRLPPACPPPHTHTHTHMHAHTMTILVVECRWMLCGVLVQ